jgi:tRNA 2-thiouridine synthesizing protein E
MTAAALAAPAAATRVASPPCAAEFDDDGFLVDAGAWSPALAARLAREAGIAELGERHWDVIRLVRKRWFALGALPVMRLVCRAAGVERDRAHELFAGCRSLWRIAGLPNPGEEAKAYMS